MAITMRQIKNLKVLVDHAKADLSFGSEGSYSDIDKNGDRVFTKKEADQAREAIALIESLYI